MTTSGPFTGAYGRVSFLVDLLAGEGDVMHGATGWAVLTAFLVLFGAGVVAGVWALGRSTDPSGRSPRDILDERLARGEISPEEHGERAGLLEGTRGRRARDVRPVAAFLVVIGLVGALVTLAAGASFDSSPGSMNGVMGEMMRGPMMGGATPGATAPRPSPGAKRVRVVADEFRFEPRAIRVHAGQAVNLVLENRGELFHTFTIDKLHFEVRANGGTSATGALTVTTAGRYPFICSVPGHAAAGMRGTVVVT